MFPVDSKILIVDDSSLSRALIRNSLREFKYTSTLEADCVQAAQVLMDSELRSTSPIRLLIADLHMKQACCLELVRWVRSHNVMNELPVIVMTTAQERDRIIEAGRLGVSNYIVKPFEPRTLRDRMESTWERHGRYYFAKMTLDS